MMNSLKLREMLNNLGSRISQLDNDYATKVRDVVMPSNPDSSPLSVARGAVGYGAGFPLFQGPGEILDEMTGLPRQARSMGERAIQYSPMVTSAAARYVLPGAGLTAAGAGLADLTANFYESMSNTPVLES